MTVQRFVDRERARLRVAHAVAGVALAAAVSCGIVSFGILALGRARWLVLPRVAPFVIWTVLVVADAAIVWWTWTRVKRAGARHRVAAEIEREQSLRAGSLRGVLEVADSGALGRLASERIASRLERAGRSLAPATQRRARVWAMEAAAAAIVAVLLLGWAAPAFGDGLLALLLPVRAWRGTLLPKLDFRGLPSELVRGERLDIRIGAPFRGVVKLTQRVTGESWRTIDVPVSLRDGIARATLGPINGDLTLVASDGRSTSDTATVHVTDRPFVGGLSLRAVYPAYLGRSAEGLPVGEPARVPQGTQIEIAGRASTQLSTIELHGEKETLALRPDGHAFAGRLDAQHSGRWVWLAAGPNGPIADVPLPLELEVVPDSAPHIDVVSPRADTIVAADDRVALQLTASDDHGLASIDVQSWRQTADGHSQPMVVQRLATPQAPVWTGIAQLDLAPRELQPGDVLHIKAVAVDNSPWAQHGESRELLLKIPTMEERRALARAAADSTVRAASAAAASQRSLEQRTSEVARTRDRSDASSGSDSRANGGEKEKMSFETAERSRAVASDQKALLEKVKNLQQQAAQLAQQLRQAGAMDSSLARQLRDAQALLQQALTPDLLAQMQKLEDATRQLSGDDARQSLKELAAMQERLRQQLEKSAEMLKRAAYEGSMQTLHDEANDIADREHKLADSASSMDKQSTDERTRNLADRSQRLAEDMKQLQQRLEKDKADPGAHGAEEASQHARQSSEDLKSRGQSPRSNQGDESRKQGSDSAQAEGSRKQSSDSSKAEGSRKQGSDSAQNAMSQKSGQGAQSMPGGQSAGQKSQPGQSGQNAGQQQQSRQGGQNAGQNGQGNQSGQNQGQQSQSGQNEGLQSAANEMDKAAQAMGDARSAQVSAWKQELTGELDRAVQEMLQMSRQEGALEQKARSGQGNSSDMRGEQSAISEGVKQTAQKLDQEAKKTSLLSSRSQRAMADANQKVAQATQALGNQRGASDAANSLGEAADALNRAAASLARDREKANVASSASGFAEMLQQMQEMAKRQGGINAQAQQLLPMPGGQPSPAMQATARALARQQQQIAQELDDMGANAGGDRAAQLAKEARQLADALEGGRVDAQTIARQQQLFRRLLDAGRSLEKDEREDTGKREAKAATGSDVFTPQDANAVGRAAAKFREPTWNELRGLTPDERRAILDYFKTINGQP